MTALVFPRRAYCDRIALSDMPERTTDGLAGLVRAQLAAIPFENLDVLAGTPVRLDAASIVDKLLHRGRGGYCFELNALASMALVAAGFEVSAMMARVTLGGQRNAPLAHQVLKVTLADEPLLVDVGFGGPGLVAPMPMRAGETVEQAGVRFRLVAEEDGELHLQREDRGVWGGIYRISPVLATAPDIEMANHFVSTYPRSPFRNRFMCARPFEGGMWQVDGRALVRRDMRLVELERSPLAGPRDLTQAMRSVFGSQVSDDIAARAWEKVCRNDVEDDAA